MSARVTADDLLFAADWIEAYDGAPDDANNAAAARVGAWLRAEVARREEDAAVERLMKSTGADRARARRVLREVRASSAAEGAQS